MKVTVKSSQHPRYSGTKHLSWSYESHNYLSFQAKSRTYLSKRRPEAFLDSSFITASEKMQVLRKKQGRRRKERGRTFILRDRCYSDQPRGQKKGVSNGRGIQIRIKHGLNPNKGVSK